MKDGTTSPAIYTVLSDGADLKAHHRTTLSRNGVTEVGHLQKWVLANPSVLGEELLVLSREYAGFDKSNKRLDVLGLDRDGKLVVVELKLDTTGHFADLQAINYAAMVSTLTMGTALEILARHLDTSIEEARRIVLDFLEPPDGELPELDDRPRVIIAAGGFGGLEITSTALWLRTFGIDIRLVEIAPYEGDGGSLILVPRVLIPLPEAASYVVGHEKKEEAQRKSAERRAGVDYRRFLEHVAEEFDRLSTQHEGWLGHPKHSVGRHYRGFAPESLGLPHVDVHYEWVFDQTGFTVGLHLERRAAEGGGAWNAMMADRIIELVGETERVGRPLERLRSAKTWNWVGYAVEPRSEVYDLSERAALEAAHAMLELVTTTRRPLETALMTGEG